MDNATYTDVALRLANADLTSTEGLRAALHDEPWWSERVQGEDLALLCALASSLRRALDAAIANDNDTVLAETNRLLEAHPPRPRLSGHGGSGTEPNWHVHVAGADEPAATEVAAVAAWGFAQGIVQHGTHRWGQCSAEGCHTYYLDTSTNQAKRFCSPRCANRVHVAAHRARRR